MSAPTAVVRPARTHSLSPSTLLVVGLLLHVVVGLRWSLDWLAWIAPVPLLLYLRRTDGWRSRVLLGVGLAVAASLQTAKIITPPIPWIMAPAIGIPGGLGAGVAYSAFEWLRRRLGDGWGLALFPALVIVSDWSAYALSSSGVWPSLANTQLHALPLTQVASLLGITAISGLLAAVAAIVAVSLETGRVPMRATLNTTALLLVGTVYGTWRLEQLVDAPTVRVAGVVTDVGLDGGGLPSPETLRTNEDTLFARSQTAVDQGAALVVWNEGATAVLPEQEAPLLARAERFAADTGVDLIVAYIVVESTEPFHFANRLVVVGPEGVVHTYDKHVPAPGEPSDPSSEPVSVLERPWGILGTAICYDFDFPGLARQSAGAGVVAVPASDWRGIDPLHGQMAALRGIESGYSVIRPVRWATSLATDAVGHTRGAASWWAGDRLLVADVPRTPVWTLYATIGDVLPLGALGLLLAGVGTALARGPRE